MKPRLIRPPSASLDAETYREYNAENIGKRKSATSRLQSKEEWKNWKGVVKPMNDKLTKDGIKYMISRLLKNASEAAEQSKQNREDAFSSGRALAYYEMLDILQSELDARGQDLREYGLDVDLAARYV